MNLRRRIFAAATMLALLAGAAWGTDRVDSKIRFNDMYGEVKIRPNSEEDDAYEFAEFDTIIYENDRIKTEEDSGAVLGLRDMSTFVIKPETIVIVDTEDGNINKLEMLIGCIIGNMKKTAEGKNLDFEMSECVAGRKGTIFALEETGSESKVYTFAGEMEVTSKKTGKKRSVMPGEFATVGTDGKINMQEFSIEQEAGRFGISMEEIANHYTNTAGDGFTARYPGGRSQSGYPKSYAERAEQDKQEDMESQRENRPRDVLTDNVHPVRRSHRDGFRVRFAILNLRLFCLHRVTSKEINRASGNPVRRSTE